MNRRIALVLILILTASSLIVVKPAHSSITKPSVPEFTVKLVDSSYDVSTTYSIDPYTGENVTHTGYHVESRTIELSIKNQPFTPYSITENENNWTINFLYNIRIKGHFSEDWIELYRPSDGYPSQNYESEYTVLSYTGEYSSTEGMKSFIMGTKMIDVPPGGQVDFQVEAMIGYVHRALTQMNPYIFTGETSGWSNTQTITIGTSTPTATPNTSPSPSAEPTPNSNSEPFPTTLVVASVVLVAVIGVGLMVYFKKRNRKS
jgi:hypothetical protein